MAMPGFNVPGVRLWPEVDGGGEEHSADETGCET